MLQLRSQAFKVCADNVEVFITLFLSGGVAMGWEVESTSPKWQRFDPMLLRSTCQNLLGQDTKILPEVPSDVCVQYIISQSL